MKTANRMLTTPALILTAALACAGCGGAGGSDTVTPSPEVVPSTGTEVRPDRVRDTSSDNRS